MLIASSLGLYPIAAKFIVARAQIQGLRQAAWAVLAVALVVGVMLVFWLPLAKDRNYMTRAIDSRIFGRIARLPKNLLYAMAVLGFVLTGLGEPFTTFGVLIAAVCILALSRQSKDRGTS